MSQKVVKKTQIKFANINLTDEELRSCVQEILDELTEYNFDAEPIKNLGFRTGFTTAMRIVVIKLLNPDLDI